MILEDQKTAKIQGLEKVSEFLFFANWCATPSPLREPKTQIDLALHLQVNQATLSQWKRHPQFWTEVRERTVEWGRERTPNVIAALYRKAVKEGNSFEAKLWLQYIEGWSEKTETLNKNVHLIITRGTNGSRTRPVSGSVSAVAGTGEPVVEPAGDSQLDSLRGAEGTQDNL